MKCLVPLRIQSSPSVRAAGVANLQLIDDLGLVENARTVGTYFNSAMKSAFADHPHVAEVRGDGLLCAVEFAEDKAERRFYDPARKIGPTIAAALLSEGVIARAMPQGDIIGFAPPLCLTRSEADTVVAAMRVAVDRAPF